MTNPQTTARPAAMQRAAESLNFPAMVSRYRDQIAMALPAHVDPDRLVRSALHGATAWTAEVASS